MPNGGSDCCASCWFNSLNEGQRRYMHGMHGDHAPVSCAIRNLAIENPFYTYCANHPKRTQTKLTVPIGPVFVYSAGQRFVWKLSPDTEEIRLKLLELLKNIGEEPKQEYRHGYYLDEVVIFQLAEFRERRAVEDLERIAKFDAIPSGHSIFRDNVRTVTLAKQALERINEVTGSSMDWRTLFPPYYQNDT